MPYWWYRNRQTVPYTTVGMIVGMK